MVLKKSIKQNLVIKNLDVNNAVLGSDGLLWEKNDAQAAFYSNESYSPSPSPSAASSDTRNALVFLNNEQENDLAPKSEEKIKRTRKKKIQ